jgi:uncharacterized protein (TIGR03086 family)
MSAVPAQPVALPSTVAGGFALLERAMGYTLGSLALVTPDLLPAPTPCERWDLRRLLRHMDDSLRALHEAMAAGHLDLAAGAPTDADYGDRRADPVGVLRNRACRMMGAWADPRGPTAVTIGDAGLPAGILAVAGAVEVAVHGWDVARACGADRTVPEALAAALLGPARLFVDEGDRPHRFGPAVVVRADAGPDEKLLGHLGRRAHWAPGAGSGTPAPHGTA